jgi:hypothetical protein
MPMAVQSFLLVAVLSSCGPSTRGAAESEPQHENSPRAAGQNCFNDPEQLARQAVNTARDVGVAGLVSPLTMDKAIFGRFISSTGGNAADIEMLWQMHRSDLDLGDDFLEACRGGPLTIDEVAQEAGTFEAFEVHGTCTGPDGQTDGFKVEQIKFEGCIYVGNIE